MTMVEALQRAIDYIENHLQDEITIEGIARQAHLSSFHFQRLFMILTDMTVAEYVRRRRLTLAAQELISSDCKVIDLALKYGYDTPEAFSKAFRKHHGITPTEARRGKGRLESYNRLSIQENLKGAEPMKYRIVEKESFEVVGRKQTVSFDDMGEAISRFWNQLNQDGTVEQLVRLNNGEIKGVMGLSADYNTEENKMDYWIAVESTLKPGEDFEVLMQPASKWAVFEVRGPVPDSISRAWKQIFSEWFPSNGYEHTGGDSFEVYISEDPTQNDSYMEIWIPVK